MDARNVCYRSKQTELEQVADDDGVFKDATSKMTL